MFKTVLITGASSGFGAESAEALARDGWRVFASMRSIDKGRVLEERSLSEGWPGSIDLVEMDVADPTSVQKAVNIVSNETGGRLDALLNNAGYSVMGAFEDLSDAECRHQMDTNFFGVLNVTRAILPMMRQAGKGRVAVVTSNAVNSPHPMLTMYAASKWALEGWAEGLAMEVAPFGIEIVVVQPGAHKTPFAQHVVPVMPKDSAYVRWMEAIEPSVADLGRWGRDPARATQTLVDAVARAEMPFRTALGEDSSFFSAMKSALPYEARALILRAIINAPAPGSFIGPSSKSEDTVTAQVARRVHDGVKPDMIDTLIRLVAQAVGARD